MKLIVFLVALFTTGHSAPAAENRVHDREARSVSLSSSVSASDEVNLNLVLTGMKRINPQPAAPGLIPSVDVQSTLSPPRYTSDEIIRLILTEMKRINQQPKTNPTQNAQVSTAAAPQVIPSVHALTSPTVSSTKAPLTTLSPAGTTISASEENLRLLIKQTLARINKQPQPQSADNSQVSAVPEVIPSVDSLSFQPVFSSIMLPPTLTMSPPTGLQINIHLNNHINTNNPPQQQSNPNIVVGMSHLPAYGNLPPPPPAMPLPQPAMPVGFNPQRQPLPFPQPAPPQGQPTYFASAGPSQGQFIVMCQAPAGASQGQIICYDFPAGQPQGQAPYQMPFQGANPHFMPNVPQIPPQTFGISHVPLHYRAAEGQEAQEPAMPPAALDGHPPQGHSAPGSEPSAHV